MSFDMSIGRIMAKMCCRESRPCVLMTVLSAVIFSGCSSSRVLSVPYEKVSDAAKARFLQNTWTPDGSRRAVMKEGKNYVQIKYHEWEFPNVKIYSEVYVKPHRSGGSKVWVYVKDCNSWFYPFTFSPALASGVLDAFDRRMKWHSLSWGEMPWDEYNKK